MPRKRMIDDIKLIELIRKFYEENCNGNARKLKLPAISDYIAENGYDGYRVETLRRTPAAREYIESLRNTSENNDLCFQVAYKTLDVEAFMDNNRTRASMKRALTELDSYYRNISDNASVLIKQYKILKDENDSLKTAIDSETEKAKELALLKKANQELSSQVKKLSLILENYVYPEIANELLSQEGILIKKETFIDAEKLKTKMITPESSVSDYKLSSGSSVVSSILSDLGD